METKKYVCGMTLYYPEHDVIEKIKNYSDLFSKVYLFDNTEKHNLIKDEIQNLTDTRTNLVYITENKNQGLPYAFNRIIDMLEEDVDYFCTLDQDSLFNERDIKSIIKKINSANVEKVGIVAPHVIYDMSEDVVYSNIAKKKRYLIASGSFLNIKALKKYDIRYDEKYFIDKFEIDLGEQLKLNGYCLYMFYGSVLYQSLGEKDSKGKTNHSVLRHYYLFRNRFYFNNKFYSFPRKQILSVLQTLRHMAQIALTEENKSLKMKQLIYGYRDFKRGNMYECKRR